MKASCCWRLKRKRLIYLIWNLEHFCKQQNISVIHCWRENNRHRPVLAVVRRSVAYIGDIFSRDAQGRFVSSFGLLPDGWQPFLLWLQATRAGRAAACSGSDRQLRIQRLPHTDGIRTSRASRTSRLQSLPAAGRGCNSEPGFLPRSPRVTQSRSSDRRCQRNSPEAFLMCSAGGDRDSSLRGCHLREVNRWRALRSVPQLHL